jgi:hypothetical protein
LENLLNAIDLAGYWEIDPSMWNDRLVYWMSAKNGGDIDDFLIPTIDSFSLDDAESTTIAESLKGLISDNWDVKLYSTICIHHMAHLYHQRNYSTDRVVVWDVIMLSVFLSHFCKHTKPLQTAYADYFECITNGCDKPLFYALLYANNQCPGGFIILYHCKTKQFLVLDQERATRHFLHYQKAVVSFGLLLVNFAKEKFSFSGSLQKHVQTDVDTLEMSIMDSVSTDSSIKFIVENTTFWKTSCNSLFANMLPFYTLYLILLYF